MDVLPVIPIYIGFDFSINKPACTVILPDNRIKFFIWPLELSNPELEKYSKTDIKVYHRNLSSISKKGKNSTSNLVEEHTKRSIDLAKKIVDDLIDYIFDTLGKKDEWSGNPKIEGDVKIYVSSEGLSFSSKGNSTLDLATYKGVLLAEIWQRLKPYKMYTYAPITIKKVAGVSSSKDFTSKFPMIDAFIAEDKLECNFKDLLSGDVLKAKTNYIHCVDDIVDSYFCCKTMYKKEKLTGVDIWDE